MSKLLFSYPRLLLLLSKQFIELEIDQIQSVYEISRKLALHDVSGSVYDAW